MTECAIVSRDGSNVLKRIGVELRMPVVINNRVCHVSVSDYFMDFCFGYRSYYYAFGMSEVDRIRLETYLVFVKNDYRKLEMMYRNAYKPGYMQLLSDYLKLSYNFTTLSFWLKVLSENFTLVNRALAMCKTEEEAKKIIPVIVKHLKEGF